MEYERVVPVPTFLLRRATSVPPPPKLTLPHPHHHHTSAATSWSSSDDADNLSIVIKPASASCYTSLKDLIPSFNANSPRTNGSAYEAQPPSIRNRLVNRAAWAYLSPRSTSPDSEGRGFSYRRVWPRVATLLNDVRRGLFWVVEWALRLVRMRGSR